MISHRNGLGLGPGRGAWKMALPANTVLPAISGVAQQGETLSCSNGSWTNLPTSFGFQWKRGGVAIGGATANSYVLQAADVGETITCTVTASNGGGSAQATSDPTSAVLPLAPSNTALPAISGTVQEGETLTCSNGSWTNSPTSYARQWKRDGVNISGATGTTYVLAAADVGATITCAVTATNAGGSSAPATATGVGPVLPAVPVNSAVPSISGVAQEGETLSCSTGTWSNSPTSYAYQWKRDGSNISGATSSTYGLVGADVGATIACAVTASNAGGAGSPAMATGVGPVLPAVPVNSVAPAASGTAEVGQTLGCTTGTWSNSPTSYAYQWRRDGSDILGATTSSYLIVPADQGALIDCEVTASNAGGAGSPADSNDLGPVAEDRIEPIDYAYGGRAPIVPQAFFDAVDAEANDANFHPSLGPFTVNAVQDGPWSDPATWDVGVPGDNDKVNIGDFHVTYDVDGSAIDIWSIHVGGEGTFEADFSGGDLHLNVYTYVNHGTELIEDVPASTTAGKARFTIEFWAAEDPGVTVKLGWMNMGPVRRYSEAKVPYYRLGATVPVGSDQITIPGLSSTWKVGDQILLPATTWSGTSSNDPDYTGPTSYYTSIAGLIGRSQGYIGFDRGDGRLRTQDEVFEIVGRVGDTITLSGTTAYEHTWRSATNSITGYVATLAPVIANMTRNILFRSRDPSTRQTRGHVMAMHNDDVVISGNEMQGLGRSFIDPSMVVPFGPTIRASSVGADLAVATNVRGRYAGIHVHNTGPYFGRKQVIVTDNVAWPGPDPNALPLPGWVYAHHGSRAAFERNIAYNFRGAGMVSELGNEIGQWIGNLMCWGRGDGFTNETYDRRGEHCQNHNGHNGVAYENQARQVLNQDNLFSSCHVVQSYFQQSASPEATLRIPDDKSLRLFHPLQAGGGHTPPDPAAGTYGVEQAQIPDNLRNSGWGCRKFWVGSHRNTVDRRDNTPGIFRECHVYGIRNDAFDLFNYSSQYGFYDCWWNGTGTGHGGAAANMGNVSNAFVFVGLILRDFQVGFADGGVGFNEHGGFVDIDFGNVVTHFTNQNYSVSGNTDPTTHPHYQQYPSWVTVAVGTPAGGYTYKLRQFNHLLSADLLAGIPDPDLPDPMKGAAPDPGLPNPKPYVVFTGTDLTTSATAATSITFSANIVDHMGPRYYPSHLTWSGSTTANFSDVRPYVNTNQTGLALAQRVGVWNDGGTIKARCRVPERNRLTGEYFYVDNADLQTGFDVVITGLSGGDVTANTIADPNVLLEGFELPLKPEKIPLTAVDIPVTPPGITSSVAVTCIENQVLAHLLTGNRIHLDFAIDGGADAADLEIVRVSGRPTLRWAGNVTRDYEAPDDAGTNNVYNVDIRVTDSFGNTQVVAHTVTVLNKTDTVTTPFFDGLNGFDGALDNSPDWLALSGTEAGAITRSGTLGAPIGSGMAQQGYWAPPTGSNNHAVEGANTASSMSIGIACRYQDNANWIRLRRTGASNIRIEKSVSGVVSTVTDISNTYAIWDIYRMEVVGDDLTVKANGVTVYGPATVSSPPPASSRVGVVRSSVPGAAQWDSFGGEALLTGNFVREHERRPFWFDTAATSFAINGVGGKPLTATNCKAGDKVGVFVSRDIASGTLTTSSAGWTTPGAAVASPNNMYQLFVFDVVTDDTIGDLTIDSSVSARLCGFAVLWKAGGRTLHLEQVTTTINGSNGDPTSITPSGGAQDYVYYQGYAGDGGTIPSAGPAGYLYHNNNVHASALGKWHQLATSNAGGLGCTLMLVSRQSTSTTEDATAWTHASEQAVLATVAVWST